MATNQTLVVCEDCGGSVSRRADVCPHCGRPFGRGRSQPVAVMDVEMPFVSMVGFMVKWMIASIPAFVILAVLVSVVSAFFAAGLMGRM